MEKTDREKRELCMQNRSDAHRKYMQLQYDIKEAKADVERTQKRIIQMERDLHRVSCRKNRFDAEWENKWKHSDRIEKAEKIAKYKKLIEDLEAQLEDTEI